MGSCFTGGYGQGYRKVKMAALAFSSPFYREVLVGHLNKPFGQGHVEAGAGGFGDAAVLYLEEFFECSSLEFWGNLDADIAYADCEFGVLKCGTKSERILKRTCVGLCLPA